MLATDRFVSDLADTMQDYANVDVKIREFIIEKQSWQVGSPTRVKDYRLTGVLSESWHWHIVFGQAVLIYQIDPTEVRLYCVVPHSYVEDNSKQRALSQYVATLPRKHLKSFDPLLPTSSLVLVAGMAETIRALLYDCAANAEDRCYLVSATNGFFKDLHAFLHVMTELEDYGRSEFIQALDVAFGGRTALLNLIKEVLERTS